MGVRFLHLADSHLGARHPGGGGGDPFFANLELALAPARAGEVDLVLHGGDLFQRSRPPPRRLAEAASALTAAAEGGAHVVIVAGNHERSLHPARLLLAHPRIRLVDRPLRVRLEIGGLSVSIHGFPFVRRDPRGAFPALVRECGLAEPRDADVRVLLCHQTFDGARVGPWGYTFRSGTDVIPRRLVPADLDYGALGHIHRAQALRHPVNPRLRLVYPGATERTSRAERCERKGVIRGTFGPGGEARGRFVELPTRPVPEEGFRGAPRGPG